MRGTERLLARWWGHALCWLALLALPARAAPELYFVTEPFPPFSYAEQGKPAGPMVAVLQAVCAELKRSCRIEVMPWRRALALAQRGEADGIFTVVDTPERRAYFHISDPVVDAGYTLFARAGDDFRLSADRCALRGRTIAAYGPSATVLALDELVEGVPDVNTAIEPDNITVLRKLAAGRYGSGGLALVNEAVALHLIRTENLAGLQAAGPVKHFSYAFGLSRQRVDAAAAKAFDRALARLCRTGRTAALVKPYEVPASACSR